MTYPVSFATLAAGNQPLSDFDTMFQIAGQQGNIPCTATGTNTITLAANTNYYNPASYTNAQLVSFLAVGTSTGSVTGQIGGLGFVNVYKSGGSQAGSGDIQSGTHYLFQYWSDLNSGSGGFLIINASAVYASLNTADQTLSGGANVTPYSLGTGSGTVTVDCGKCPLQYINNNGSFTFAPPANDGACMILLINLTAAGTVTFNGSFSVGANIGDIMTATFADKYTISIWSIANVASYFIKALQ